MSIYRTEKSLHALDILVSLRETGRALKKYRVGFQGLCRSKRDFPSLVHYRSGPEVARLKFLNLG